MKVTDLEEKEVIHCETLEQYEAICQLLHEAGLRWWSGSSFLEYNVYDYYDAQTCLCPKKGAHQKKEWYEENGYIVYPANNFITPPQTKEEYAKERAIGFALWLQESDYQTVDDDAWCDMVFTTKYTTAELYDEYLKSINQKQ